MTSRSAGTVVDSKVVEMSFDNSNFESNANKSISTLGKLKEALNFTNSTKGLDEINSDIGKIKIGPLTDSVRGLRFAFDSLGDTIGFAMIQRYTNQALDSIERLVKSMSTDQIFSGWQKYGDKTTSVATLVAQGYDLETVNAQLERLNWFTDETSYNFTDMTANIAKFTATGQNLEDSVTAMEGIANWAALSGQNAQKASMAMYQLSQAMGAGVMRREDYKSIQNVSMDTQEFRQHALDAAVALGTLEKTGENTYKSLRALGKAGAEEFSIDQFAENLTEGAWFTKDVMMDVFNDYSAAVNQIYEYAEEHGMTASEAIAKAGDQFDEFGVKAFLAAQEARTFGDVIDSVKDAVSTQFMNMFEIIFGDYKQATALWTSMAKTLYDVFAQPIVDFNELLSEAFGEGSPQAEAVETMGNVVTTLDDLHKMAAEVIKGDWGDESSDPLLDRMTKLSEAGHDAQKIQDYVNKIYELTNGTWEYDEALLAEIDGYSEVEKMASEAGMKASEYLKIISEPRPTGRELMLDAMKKSFKGLSAIFKGVKDGFYEVFDPLTAEHIYNFIKGVDDLAKSFRRFAKENRDNITNIFKGLFSVLDIGIRTVKTFVGGALKGLNNALKASGINVLELIGNIGTLIFNIRNWILENNYIQKTFDLVADGITMAIDAIKDLVGTVRSLPIVEKFLGYFKDFTKDISNNKWINRFRESFKSADGSFSAFFNGITTNADGSKNSLGSFFDSVKGVFTPVIGLVTRGYGAVKEFISSLDLFGLASSSFNDFKTAITSFFTNLPDKFAGLKKSFSDFFKQVKTLGGIKFSNFKEIWKSFKETVGSFVMSKDIFGGIIDAFGNLKDGVAERLTNLGIDIDGLKDKVVGAFNTIKDAIASFNLGDILTKIKEFFTGPSTGDTDVITRLAGSIKEGDEIIIESESMWEKIKAIFASIKSAISDFISGLGNFLPTYDQLISLIVGLGILVAGLNIKKIIDFFNDLGASFNKKLNAEAFRDKALGIGIIAASIAGLAFTLTQTSPQAFATAAGTIVGIMAALAGLTFALKKIDKDGEGVKNAGEGIKNIAKAIAILAAVCAAISALPADNYKTGMLRLVGLIGAIAAIMVVMKVLDPVGISKMGINVLAMTGAMWLLVGLLEVLARLDMGKLWKGLLGLVPVLLALASVALIANLTVREGGVGTALTLLALAGSIVLIAGAMAVIGLIPTKNLKKAEIVILEIAVIIGALLAVASLAKGGAGAITGIAVLIGVMTGSLVAISLIPEDALSKAKKTLEELMTVFTMCVSLILIASRASGSGFATFAGISIALATMVGSLWIVALIPEDMLDKAEAAIIKLGLILSAMMVASKFATGSIVGIITMGVALAAVAGVLYLLTTFTDVDKLNTAADGLSKALLSLSAMMIVLSVVGAAAPAAIIGALLLAAFMTAFAAVCSLIADFVDNPEEIIDHLRKGAEIIKAIAELIGEVLGAFIGGAMNQVASYLPGISESVGTFFATMKEVSGDAEGVDLSPISKACEALKEVSFASIMSSIAGWFTDGDISAVEEFSKNLTTLGSALRTWTTEFNDLATVKIDTAGVKSLMEALDEITIADFDTLFKKLLFGDISSENIEAFEGDIKKLGSALTTWTTEYNKIGKIKIDSDGVAKLSDALKEAKTKSGGFFGTIGSFFGGSPDFEKFKTQITQLGTALVAFQNEIGDVDKDKINEATAAVTALADLGKKIGDLDLGGLFHAGDIEAFGSQISTLATELKKLASESGDTSALSASATALKTAVDSYLAISFTGDISNASLVKTFVSNIKSLKDLFKGKVSTDGAESLKKAIETISSASFKDDEAEEALDSAANLGEMLMKHMAAGIKSKKELIVNDLKTAVTAGLNSLKPYEAKFKAEGAALMTSLKNGIAASASAIRTAVNNIAISATVGLRNVRSQFESAGKYVGEGFVIGIRNKVRDAENAGKALAAAAAQGTESKAEIKSPSRVAMRDGKYFGQGWVNGILSYAKISANAGTTVATSAMSGLRKGIETIKNVLESDMDTNPTIRPVLDLSELRDGAGRIGDILNLSPTPTFAGNISAINGYVNSHNPNQALDIAQAMGALRSTLNQRTGDTYIVNGITYDDGSNVAAAVSSLIRAAKVERRV